MFDEYMPYGPVLTGATGLWPIGQLSAYIYSSGAVVSGGLLTECGYLCFLLLRLSFFRWGPSSQAFELARIKCKVKMNHESLCVAVRRNTQNVWGLCFC